MSTSEVRNWKVMLFSKLNCGTRPAYLSAQPAAEGQGRLRHRVLLFTQLGGSCASVPVPHRYGDCVRPRFGRGVFNSMLIIQKYFHLTDNLNDPITAAITIRTNPALIDSHISSQSLTPNEETRKILPFLSSFLHALFPLIAVSHANILKNISNFCCLNPPQKSLLRSAISFILLTRDWGTEKTTVLSKVRQEGNL